MTLSDYINQLGKHKAAALFEVKERTIDSWLRGERLPRRKKAREIVDRSPVTFEGIYGQP
jgi:hypothetical protein